MKGYSLEEKKPVPKKCNTKKIVDLMMSEYYPRALSFFFLMVCYPRQTLLATAEVKWDGTKREVHFRKTSSLIQAIRPKGYTFGIGRNENRYSSTINHHKRISVTNKKSSMMSVRKRLHSFPFVRWLMWISLSNESGFSFRRFVRLKHHSSSSSSFVYPRPLVR